jgi:hypothetical protein
MPINLFIVTSLCGRARTYEPMTVSAMPLYREPALDVGEPTLVVSAPGSAGLHSTC